LKKTALVLIGFQQKNHSAEKKCEKIKKTLRKHGYEVYISNYGEGQGYTQSIDDYVKYVVKEISEMGNIEIIIAHSMGGLIARSLIEQYNLKARKLIMLEVPNGGVPRWYAKRFFPLNLCVKDMTRGSNFLQKLNRYKKVETEYIHVIGLLGLLSKKTFNLQLAKTTSMLVRHHKMLTNRKIIKKIINLL